MFTAIDPELEEILEESRIEEDAIATGTAARSTQDSYGPMCESIIYAITLSIPLLKTVALIYVRYILYIGVS